MVLVLSAPSKGTSPTGRRGSLNSKGLRDERNAHACMWDRALVSERHGQKSTAEGTKHRYLWNRFHFDPPPPAQYSLASSSKRKGWNRNKLQIIIHYGMCGGLVYVYSPARGIQSSRDGGRQTGNFEIDIRAHKIIRSGTEHVWLGFLSISFFLMEAKNTGGDQPCLTLLLSN